MSAQVPAEEAKNPPIDISKAVDMGVAMPTPLDKFIALTLLVKTKKIDWNGVFNAVAVDINPDNYTDTEVLVPQVLGLRMADGIMAIQAKDAEMLGKAASDIEKLAKKIDVSDDDLSRARRVRTLANEGKWLDVYRELAFLQQDIMQKLDQNPNDQRAALLMISGWIQGSRYSSKLILAHYSAASSNILREPLLVSALIKKSEALPAKTQAAALRRPHRRDPSQAAQDRGRRHRRPDPQGPGRERRHTCHGLREGNHQRKITHPLSPTPSSHETSPLHHSSSRRDLRVRRRHAFADPSLAEEDAYNMSVYYTQRGFAMAPTNTNGVGASGTMIRFIVPVSKGLDYVFLAGIDLAVKDIDIYVYDEVGNLILDDRRPTRRAGVKFRSAYNGTVQVYLHLKSAVGLGAYSVLVGRRGAVRENYIPTSPDDSLVESPSAPAESPATTTETTDP